MREKKICVQLKETRISQSEIVQTSEFVLLVRLCLCCSTEFVLMLVLTPSENQSLKLNVIKRAVAYSNNSDKRRYTADMMVDKKLLYCL